MEKNLIGRQPQWKTNLMEDNFKDNFKLKTTLMEDNFNGKTTLNENNPNGRSKEDSHQGG